MPSQAAYDPSRSEAPAGPNFGHVAGRLNLPLDAASDSPFAGIRVNGPQPAEPLVDTLRETLQVLEGITGAITRLESILSQWEGVPVPGAADAKMPQPGGMGLATGITLARAVSGGALERLHGLESHVMTLAQRVGQL